jgi:hypothetical protein
LTTARTRMVPLAEYFTALPSRFCTIRPINARHADHVNAISRRGQSVSQIH